MIKYLTPSHPLQQIRMDMQERLARAQSNLLHLEFPSAGALCEKVFADIRLDAVPPPEFYDQPLSSMMEQESVQLSQMYSDILREAGFPEQSILLHAANLTQRTQLVEAFDSPDIVIQQIEQKVGGIVEKFPRQASDIERGKNPGDVLDPFILAATQYLLLRGSFEKAIEATVAHKALMMIEDLLGHLHEDTIGAMRGNVRIPEPRGGDQENLDLERNPFPGADVVQPPWSASRSLRFYQIKSKTGSAKGGDGKRPGEQLQRLKDVYGGEIYFSALVANTLKGHRSRKGLVTARPISSCSLAILLSAR